MTMREWFTGPERWTQRTFQTYNENDGQTKSCCIAGAAMMCYPSNWNDIYIRIGKHLGIVNIADWNDDPKRSFADIVAVVTEMDI